MDLFFLKVAIAGLVGGAATGLVLRRVEPAIRSSQVIGIAVGWAVAVVLGGFFPSGVLSGAVAGALGAGVLYAVLRRARMKE